MIAWPDPIFHYFPSTGGALALGGGFLLADQSPRWFKIFLMTSGSSIKLMMRIGPWHLGQLRGDGFYRSKILGLMNSIPSAWILSDGNSTGFVMNANPSF